ARREGPADGALSTDRGRNSAHRTTTKTLLTEIDWDQRFAAFAARKEKEARTATLSPFVTEVDRGGRDLVWVGDSWTTTLFDGPFYMSPVSEKPASPKLEGVPRAKAGLVFVQSRDGNTGAADPSSLGAGDTDKH